VKIGGGWFLRSNDAAKLGAPNAPSTPTPCEVAKRAPTVDDALQDLRAWGVL
jgi:hypothetical protein